MKFLTSKWISPFLVFILFGCSSPEYQGESFPDKLKSCEENLRKSASQVQLNVDIYSELVLYSVFPEIISETGRRFDPIRVPLLTGQGVFVRKSLIQVCNQLTADIQAFDKLNLMGTSQAVRIGLSKLLSDLALQEKEFKSLKAFITDSMKGQKKTQGRLSELIGKLAPRGLGFAYVKRGVRMTPSITIAAVNPLDQPIDAFLLTVDLRRPDNQLLVSGRLTFKPSVSLGSGVEATYVIDLDSNSSFSQAVLADYRDNIKVLVKVEDVVSNGVRLLGDSVSDPSDFVRLNILNTLLGRIQDLRSSLRIWKVKIE